MRCFFQAAMVTMGMAAALPVSAEDSADPIRLALNEWSTQQVITQITGRLLQEIGRDVELVTAGYYPQMSALETGELTATVEIWTDNVPEGFSNQVDSGALKIVSSIGVTGQVGWWYPASFEATCPGLPDYKALKGCLDQLVSEDTYPKPRFVEYPADWGNTFNAERFAALGFDFAAVRAGSEGALVAEMKAAHKSGDPLLIMMYSPHVVYSLTDFKLLELPAYEPDCETEAAWGVNPDATFDCGFAPSSIYKVAWPGMKEKWPEAYALLQQINIPLDQYLEIARKTDVEGIAQEEVVDSWLAENTATWKAWVAAARGA
ncbi:ABC transporter substrate-binding protein [Leisingera daeponensis]|uniref:ABC transporter substrate-binding protein n=1 Tax=Leisingera daeponensis TaxID=405746 RepID=A0ABS7NIP3_9RHOB|nr:ABC transporter substrate-binding protein [Leisingera daeponensis]MBY6141072.1 ABC transporter substrate-binding protein [Leisingera daeponensis]